MSPDDIIALMKQGNERFRRRRRGGGALVPTRRYAALQPIRNLSSPVHHITPAKPAKTFARLLHRGNFFKPSFQPAASRGKRFKFYSIWMRVRSLQGGPSPVGLIDHRISLRGPGHGASQHDPIASSAIPTV